jgi:hypothetical protein
MMAAPTHKKEPNQHGAQRKLEKQCEWMRGSEIPQTKNLASTPTCHSFPLEPFASRHPVKAALRLAPLGLDRVPSRCRNYSQKKEWQALTWLNTFMLFSLDIGQPSHGWGDKTGGPFSGRRDGRVKSE